MFLDNLTERTAWCTWCSWSWGGRSAFESVKHAISPSIFGAPVVSPSLVISPFFSYKNWPFMNILRNSGNIFRPIYIITPGVRALLVLLKFGCFRVECLQWPFWNLWLFNSQVPLVPWSSFSFERREHTYPCIQQKDICKIQHVKLLLVPVLLTHKDYVLWQSLVDRHNHAVYRINRIPNNSVTDIFRNEVSTVPDTFPMI